MTLSKIAALAAIPKEILSALERLPQLERRVATLEEQLKGEPCPRCKLPGWHEDSNKPAEIGAEFGLVEITYACSHCGYRKVKAPD